MFTWLCWQADLPDMSCKLIYADVEAMGWLLDHHLNKVPHVNLLITIHLINICIAYRLETGESTSGWQGTANSTVNGYNLDAEAFKGFLECPFLTEFYAPPSCCTCSLCSDPHRFLIFYITMHVWPSSERHWLWSNTYWPWLSPNSCRGILPSSNTDALGALDRQIHKIEVDQRREGWDGHSKQ